MTCSWCWGTRPTLTNLGVKFTRMQSRNIFKNKSIFCRLFLPRPVFFNYYTFTRFFPCLILPHLILIDHYFPFKSMVYQLFVNILHCVDFFIIIFFPLENFSYVPDQYFSQWHCSILVTWFPSVPRDNDTALWLAKVIVT